MPYLQQVRSRAGQIYAVDLEVAAMRHQARCWFALDHWAKVFEIESELHALKEKYPNFLNRAGAYCFLAAIFSSAHARRGEIAEARTLRDEAMAIMTAANGPPERWDRANRY